MQRRDVNGNGIAKPNSGPIQEINGGTMLLTNATTRVWIVMRETAITGSYWLGAPRTALLAECSVDQVRRAWKKMQKVKLITLTGRHGDCGVKVWRINSEVALDAYANLRQRCKEVAAMADERAERGVCKNARRGMQK